MPKADSPQYPGKAAGSEFAPNARNTGALPLVVLGLDLKLLCGKCGAKLIVDVRWQGRELNCPYCGTTALVPQYSELPRPADASRNAPPSAEPVATPSRLSEAEIAFLSEVGESVRRGAEPGVSQLDGRATALASRDE